MRFFLDKVEFKRKSFSSINVSLAKIQEGRRGDPILNNDRA